MGIEDRFADLELVDVNATAANIDEVCHGVLTGSAVWDPGNLVDGAGETKSITVTGAALGDFVLVAAPCDLVDMVVTGYVQAANTVEIRIQNESGSAANLTSGTWKVKVLS